jgi:hypothetical protein
VSDRAVRLVAAVAKGTLLLCVVGANCSNQAVRIVSDARLTSGAAPEVRVRVVGQAVTLVPAADAQRAVFVQAARPGGPDSVTLFWYPPVGATAIAFHDLQPDNPQGPPPYRFSGVAVSDVADAGAAPSVTLSYAAPAPPQPTGAAAVVDVFTAETAAGNRYSASFEDTESAEVAHAASGAGGDSPADGASSLVEPAYSYWAATETIDPVADVSADLQLCHDIASLLQGGTFFVALRFPVGSPDGHDARSVPLPVAQPASGSAVPHLDLLTTQPTPATVFSVPLELRPDYLGFAENNLPQASGERWVTLAPTAQPPATCPGDFTGVWELSAGFSLDLGGTPTSCSDCVIQEYFCTQGAAAPFVFASGASAVAQSVYQGAGTSCVGPVPLRLLGSPAVPPFAVENAGLAHGSANGVVAFAHRLRGLLAPDAEATVDLGTTSSRGVPWRLYSDSGLSRPVTGPVTISGTAEFNFWAAAQLPFGFRGPESVTVSAATADGSGQTAWSADHVWAGAWTAPPAEASLEIAETVVKRGGTITVSGVLPAGAYRLAVVPNGAYLPGTCYTGVVVAAVDVTVSGDTLPATVVWSGASAGSFDVLALAGSCTGGTDNARIVTGADLSPAAGVAVDYVLRTHLRH